MPQPIALDLTNARARLNRAVKHRLEMATLREADRDAGSFAASRNVVGNTVVIEAKYSAHPDLAIAFGEWLASLRSGLDYLFFDLAAADTGSNPPTRQGSRMFPIKETPEQFEQIRNSDTFHGMSDWTVDSIESMQPYHTKYGAKGNALLWLHDLARRDRHRMPFKMGALITKFEAKVHPVAGARGIGMDTIDPEQTAAVVAEGESMYLGRLRCPSATDAEIMSGRIEIWIDQDLEVATWYREAHTSGISANIRNDRLEERMKFIEWYFYTVLEHFETGWHQTS
ncbi:hypothetical protein CH282_07905 [Rhodococcus sp. 06-418-1B]|nr:hypothetical protein CH282_07905 [Rhodococcus sp. 06-418-1B]